MRCEEIRDVDISMHEIGELLNGPGGGEGSRGDIRVDRFAEKVRGVFLKSNDNDSRFYFLRSSTIYSNRKELDGI